MLDKIWTWIRRGAPIPQAYLAAAVVLVLAGLVVGGCGSSSRESALLAELAEAKAEVSRLFTANEKMAKGQFPPNLILAMKDARAHFEKSENGGFSFQNTKDPSDGSRIQGSDVLESTILQFSQEPDGVLNEAILSFIVNGTTKEQQAQLVQNLKEFRTLLAAEIPPEELANFVTALLQLSDEKLNLIQRWSYVSLEGCCKSIQGVKVVALTLSPAKR